MTSSIWTEFVGRCTAAERIVLVAPYIKLNALGMTLDKIGSDTIVQCFTRWTPLDIKVGASDIECRTLVKSKGGSFRLHNQLHAKYYRADDYFLTGSANLTQSGLGLSNSPNLEILTQGTPSFNWIEFEKRLLRESREVSDEEFALWERCPVSKPTSPNDGFPIIDVGDWKPQTREPDYLWLVYTGHSLPSNEQYEPATSDLEAMGVPRDLDQETFEGWVRSALMASTFVNFVLQHGDASDDRDLWDAVCQKWNVDDRAAALRFVETAQIWLLRFCSSGLRNNEQTQSWKPSG